MLQSPYVSVRIRLFSNPRQSYLCHSEFEIIDYSQKQKSNKKQFIKTLDNGINTLI